MKNKYYGVDTETYTEGGEGLLSIQVHGEGVSEYFGLTPQMLEFDDEDIRDIIIDDFHYFLDTLKGDAVFYFFNLKFDFSQMEKYFLTNYQITEEWNIKKGEMKILQSQRDVYSVRFRNPNTGRMVYFNDLFHLVNTSLNKASRAFTGNSKIAMDNMTFRKELPSVHDVKYAMQDAKLTYDLATALKDVDGFDMTESLTIGSRSLRLFTDVIKKFGTAYNLMGHVITLDDVPKKDIWSHFGITEKDNLEFEKWIRLGVRGGITQAFQTGEFEDCVHLDICSAHPSQMVKKVPYGPMCDEPPTRDFIYMAFPNGDFELKKGGLKIMTFTNKALCERYRNPNTDEELHPATFVSSFSLDGSYGIWQDEYEQILSQYDFEPALSTVFKYFELRHDVRLSALVKELYNGKENAKGAKRQVFKYLLNSLYGKFLTRPDGQSIEYEYQPDGTIARVPIVDDGRKTVNLALGSWISMMTRVQLVDACLAVPRDTLLYTDTDSVIFKRYEGWEKDFTLGDDLGDWGLESEPSHVRVLGPKTYQELIDGKCTTKCAGLSRRITVDMEYGDLKEGMEVTVLKARRNPVTLAIALRELPHTVSTKPNVYLGGH